MRRDRCDVMKSRKSREDTNQRDRGQRMGRLSRGFDNEYNGNTLFYTGVVKR